MNIIGENIVLRAIELEDAQLLKDLMNNPETEAMLLGWSYPVSMQGQLEWIKNLNKQANILRCIIQITKTSEAIGTVILSNIDFKNGTAGIHIKIIGQNNLGKGYGYNTIKAMVYYAFEELRLNCVYAQVASYNEASLRLFAKCGFEREGVLRNRYFKKGKYIDAIVFSILKT